MAKEKQRIINEKDSKKENNEVYEKSSDLFDALNNQANKKLVDSYKAYYKF